MASKNINVALLLTINLVFFGFTMAQDPVPQAPTCSKSSNVVEGCVDDILSAEGFDILAARTCCSALKRGIDASEASVCICDAVKLLDTGLEPTDAFRKVTNICYLNPPAGFRCA